MAEKHESVGKRKRYGHKTLLQPTATIGVIIGLIYLIVPFRETSKTCPHAETKTLFLGVDNKFCCSLGRKHWTHSDALDLVEKERDMLAFFKESPVYCKKSRCFGSSTRKEFVENLEKEAEVGKNKISKLKDKEHIFKFRRDRFAVSPEDIWIKKTYVHHFSSTLNPKQPN